MIRARSFVANVLALCGFALTSIHSANADIITITPTADAYIMSDADGANYNFGCDPFMIGFNDTLTKTNMLLHFNVSGINPSAVRSARLRLWSTGWMGDYVNTAPTSVFALATPWSESEVNWYQASNGNNWRNCGGDLISEGANPLMFAMNTEGMSIPDGGTAMMEWDITTLVRNWANRTLPNYGLRIDTSDGIFLFESRESMEINLRPTLIIDYTNLSPSVRANKAVRE